MRDAAKQRSWRHGHVGDCVASMSSGTSVNGTDDPAAAGEVGVLKVSCVATGAFRPEQNKRVLESDIARVSCPVEAGCIIVSRANTADLVGSSALIECDMPNIYLSDKLWKIRTHDQCDPVWLYFSISSPEVRRRLSSGATGSSASMKNISQEFFLSSPIEIPPLTEQRKIAEILSAWDSVHERYAQKLVTPDQAAA
ncbi:MAG: type I restriction enzyme, S subunit [Rhodobacteraceae bacterium HLUCCA12]|nr:MAG: type I restriction enzyme, S subunit [Rhodobacteraceae bacterium HLUCCA12]